MGCWCLWWGWWSHLHPWPEQSLLKQAPFLLAGLFSLFSILVLLSASLWTAVPFLLTLVLTQHYSNFVNNGSITSVSPEEGVFPFLVLLAQVSIPRWLIIGSSWPSCKILPSHEQKKVFTRLCAVLVKSIRAHHSEASLPWAESQLISTAIIKRWSLCDGQPPCHPWRGCWKHCVSGKPSSADGHIPPANAYLAPVCAVTMRIALLL